MIKLEIEIKEEMNKDYETIKAIATKVSIKEIGIMATEGERKTSNLLKNRLKVEKKLQFVNQSSEDIEKIIQQIIKEG